MSSSLLAFPGRTQSIRTPYQDVACSCQWLTQKDTLALMQSKQFASFLQETHELKSYASAFIGLGMVVASVMLILASNSNGNHHENTTHAHVHIGPESFHPFSPVSLPATEAQLPVLNDLTDVTLENLHRHITPIKVRIDNDSENTLIISKNEYLSAFQTHSVSLDALLHLFPNIEHERLPLYLSTAGYAVSLLACGGFAGFAAALAKTSFTEHSYWKGGFTAVLGAALAVIAGFSGKYAYKCWNSVTTLNELKANQEALVNNLSIVYDRQTGKELSPDEYSFGFAIPPHATFESLLFVRTDKCEEFILNAAEQGTITLNARQLHMRDLKLLHDETMLRSSQGE